ncbi:MAG TPA: adenylate/guanylate cyclase domain-containing protein [Candidatus Tectomicrobia bacterium]|nr:adenylate/guanylate cyclase domain-containing protein [Candidatus Tectomicrobia bacterium]
MQCPHCLARNREGRRFCGECGAPLALPCTSCGFSNEPAEKFCGGCGQPLTPAGRTPEPSSFSTRTYTPSHLAEKILTSKSVLEGERKQVTVLFADLKDSTELIRGLDPEVAQRLLDPALRHMMDAVHRFEGTVNQVLGDGIMALFGAPIAHEDHALRACYAALAMQAAMRAYTEEVRRAHGLEMRIRVGLNSGEVVVRAIGNDLHMDYSAVGETTHLAARMEQLATPGSIRLTAATLRLVEGLVQVNSLGPVPVKGIAEPVEVFELLGASGTQRRVQAAAARGLTRFVGRQTEMATLTNAMAQAEAGHGQVVALVGEAGVGKSRLVYELTHSHHIHGWLVLESASVSYGKATPYFPVIDLLKRYAHVEEHDDARTIRAKVTGQVLILDEALQDTIPALLLLLEALLDDSSFLQLDPSQRRQRTLTALKRVLLRESRVQPLVLLFEDLHWIDSETQALLDSLVESLPTVRVLLLVNYRPEYQHGWGAKTYYTQVRLDPLPLASAEELLQVLLGDDSGLVTLKRLLIARTEGNPFFLEESVRALVETAVLEGNPGDYHLVPRVGVASRGRSAVANHRGLPLPIDIHMPATVQAVLAARIDRLPPEEKRLLQTAAVIGNEIPLPLLQTVGDLPEEALHRGLAHLQAAEFLYETRLFPEQEYTFKHALTHEVAYGSLLQERRRALHARIVEALEALVPDRAAEQVERLAHHALRGEVWDKAVTYCRQAGARAHDRAAFHEAVAAFEQSLQVLAHLPESGDTRGLAFGLRLALGGTLTALGEYGRCLALLGEAEALAKALDDRVRLGRVLAQTAAVLRNMGDHDGAIAAGQQALALAVTLGDSSLQAQASLNLGQACYVVGDFGRAAELLRWNVEAADRESGTASTDVRLRSQAWLALTLSDLGAFAEGRRHGEEARRLGTLAGRGTVPIGAHGCLGLLTVAQGDLEHAIRVFDQGLALCRASGDRNWLRWILAGLGYAYALQGRLVEGRALLEEASSESIRTGGLRGHAHRVAWLSEVCRLAGRYDEAWQHGRQALDLARQQKERGSEARALHQLGVLHARATPSDVEQAEAHYQEALALAEALGMRPLQAHCHFGLGKLYTKLGRCEQARCDLSAAIDLYRDMEMTFWLPQAEAALAQVE